MSEFVMGAKLNLESNFTKVMREADSVTQEFKQTVVVTNRVAQQFSKEATQFSNTANAASQATSGLTGKTRELSGAVRSIEDFLRDVNSTTNQTVTQFSTLRASIQQFNRGTEALRNLPSTLRTLASTKLTALGDQFTKSRLQASLLVGAVKSLAQQKVTTLTSNVKQLKTFLTEGKSGAAGFGTGLKNIAKISLSSTANAMKNITSKVKEFAQTKVTSVVNGFKDLKTRATGGETGVKGLFNALKKAAGVSFSALHTGLSKVGSLAVSAGSKIASGLGGAISGLAKGLSVGVGVAGAAMAGLTVKALNLGGDLEQNIGGSEAVFKEFAATMQETGKTAFSKMGLAQSDFLATANKMGALFQGSGFGIKESADMSSKAMQRAADVASIMGIDVNEAMEAVAGAAKGNFTMMDNLGVAMNDTAIAAYAMSKGIKKSSQQMTQQEKVGLAMEMFLDKTTYAAGNYAKENDTLAGSLTTAKAAMSNFLAGSGSVDDLVNSFVNASTIIVDKVTEIVPRLATGVAEAIGAIMPKVPGILAGTLPMLLTAATKMFQSLITTVQQNKQPLIGLAVSVITSLANFLLDAIPQIILVGADILIGFVQGMVKQLPQILTTAATAIKTLADGLIKRMPMVIQTAIQLIQTLAQGLIDNLPMMIQAAIQLIGGLLSGLVSRIPQLVQTAIQLIRTIQDSVWACLPQIIQTGVQLIVSLVQGVVQSIPMIIDGMIQGLQAFITTIIKNLPLIIQAAVQIVVALAVGLLQAIPQLVAAIPQLVSAIVDTILNTNWLDVGWQIVKGIGNGLLDGVKSIFGFGKDSGKAAADGTLAGLESSMGQISSASATTANTFTTGMQPDFTAISGYGLAANTTLADSLTASAGLVTDASSGVTTQITDTFGAVDLYGSGADAMAGLNDGMLSKQTELMTTAKNIANGIKTQINSALDIHSPSKVMEESGKFTGQGLIVGINKTLGKVRAAAQGLSDTAMAPFATQSVAPSAISTNSTPTGSNPKGDRYFRFDTHIAYSDASGKGPRELVDEFIQLVYEKLADADDILSHGEMAALL